MKQNGKNLEVQEVLRLKKSAKKFKVQKKALGEKEGRGRERMKGRGKGRPGSALTQIWLESLLLPAVHL